MVPAARTSWSTRLLVVLSLIMAGAALPAAPATAHGGTCRGLPVTIFASSPDDDVIEGTEGDDIIHGLGGNDIIYGLGGDDIICGGGGDDYIVGGEGNDLLVGGWGDDRIRGGAGDDDLRGNPGNDRLYGQLGIDSVRGGTGSDACGAEIRLNCEMKKRTGHDPIDWIELVEEHFGPVGDKIGAPDLVDEALIVMDCESSGEPFAENPVSSASGLFQFLQGTWDRWNPKTDGWAGESVFHPEANIATAARLVLASVREGQDRWWQWSCKPY